MNGTPLGRKRVKKTLNQHSSISMNGTQLGPVGFGTNASTILASR